MKLLLVRLSIVLAFASSAIAAIVLFRGAGMGVIAGLTIGYLTMLILVIAILLNYPRLPRQAAVNDFADELAAKGLLECTSFVADRAFRVEAAESEEGPHYFLELEDGSILHLCGSYLYDYEPGPQSLRHFPCTQFTIRRHAELGYTVDLLCGGLIIEPELDARAYSEDELARHRAPEDAAILRGLSFTQLRDERAAGHGLPH